MARILVAEDTELLRRIYHDRLTQDGHTVLTAADGIEALELARSQTPDLIMLDLVMPRMDGLQALQTLKSDAATRDIPVIVLSNLGQETDIQRGLQLGAVDYLIKNASKPMQVSEKIRMVLESRRRALPAGVRIPLEHSTLERLLGHTQTERCEACGLPFELELIPNKDRPGWFDAHVVCGHCDMSA